MPDVSSRTKFNAGFTPVFIHFQINELQEFGQNNPRILNTSFNVVIRSVQDFGVLKQRSGI